MRNIFKKSCVFIIILFLTLILPFNVLAKQSNTFIDEDYFDSEELISGDTLRLGDATTYIPVDNQNLSFTKKDKVSNIEYYIIDSIDSNGNIKYKKYDFSNSDKSVWYPDSSSVFNTSGYDYSDFKIVADTVDFYNSCSASRNNNYLFSDNDSGYCNIVLPSINGKISRWRFDSLDYEDEKDVDLCKFVHLIWSNDFYYSSCDTVDDQYEKSTYVGTYKYYTSYVYKFYQLPDEQPETKITCDTNMLNSGKTSKCTINFSYKYGLSNILFDITSDKLKISNLQFDDYWEDDTDSWTSKEITNGYSLSFAYKYRITDYYNNPVIATFDVTADENIDDVVALLNTSDIKYVEKTGDGIVSNGDSDSGDITDNILNPSTFRNSYYLVIGIIIIGGISFIQLRSKKKNK